MLINSFERDARNEGWKAGIAQGIAQGRTEGIAQGRTEGIAQGRTEGIAQGSHQARLETAMAFKRLGVDIAKIAEGTGLSREEIEAL